jgi:predicted metal-dependent TIM-barrel fold hydrolase
MVFQSGLWIALTKREFEDFKECRVSGTEEIIKEKFITVAYFPAIHTLLTSVILHFRNLTHNSLSKRIGYSCIKSLFTVNAGLLYQALV